MRQKKQVHRLLLWILSAFAFAGWPREARHADWVNPKGGAHGCAPFPEAQDAPYGNSQSACGPNGFIVGRAVGRLSFGYFSLPFKEK
ncbi:MAG: hypothetical protein ACREO0_03695 [Pseudoxanthomonas sp.]